jgi:hypothetical protein
MELNQQQPLYDEPKYHKRIYADYHTYSLATYYLLAWLTCQCIYFIQLCKRLLYFDNCNLEVPVHYQTAIYRKCRKKKIDICNIAFKLNRVV